MRIEIACFTERGRELAEKVKTIFEADGNAVGVTRCGSGGETLAAWTAGRFNAADALVFVGAAGIAVRAIAPHVVSKTSDPAVLVADETGRFVIPVLSGHIGGANRLADALAKELGATAVVTTATDLNRVFAVDVWATERGYAIRNPEGIRAVSAKLLRGESVGVKCAFPIEGGLPPGLRLDESNFDFLVDIMESDARTLHLVPPAAVLGVGCKKGTSAQSVEAAFTELCGRNRICPEAVGLACSIDLKRDEEGLLAFAEKRGLPFAAFSAGELAAVPGDFAASDFVERTTGVDNVCERSAVAGSGCGRLIVGKTVFPGMAMAVAVRDFRVAFDGE